MKFLHTSIVLLLLLLGANSCNLINPTEPVPTYIHVDSFSFAGIPSTGDSSSKITCVYAYLNNQSIGIFDLPITFPVIMDKHSRLQLTPGFDYNGLAGVPTIQPFFISWSDSIMPAPGQIINTKPSSSYINGTLVKYFVNFEATPPFTTGSLVGKMARTGVDTLTIPGQGYAGLVYLEANEDSATNYSIESLDLPALKECYLEISYKSNIPFTVGLYTSLSGGFESLRYLAGFNPHPGSFNKVYIDLKNFVSSYQGGKYTILLRAIKEDSQIGKPGYVSFDNIKIVSF